MDLGEFIKLTLSQIIDGVKQAATKSNGKIAPPIGAGDDAPKMLRTDAPHGWHGVFLVEYDVALTASDKSAVSGGGKANVYVATVGAEAGKATESGSTHRVKFSVPISYQAANKLTRA
jgi:hypothetical protein